MIDLVDGKDLQTLHQAQGRYKELEHLSNWLKEIETFAKEVKENG